MSPTLDAFLCSWPFDPWLLAALALSATVYCRGWLCLHRRDARRWSLAAIDRLCAFLGGLATIFVALGSPIELFASLLLQVHMVQHLLLLMAAPPLLWLASAPSASRSSAGCRARSAPTGSHPFSDPLFFAVCLAGSRTRRRRWPSSPPRPGAGTSLAACTTLALQLDGLALPTARLFPRRGLAVLQAIRSSRPYPARPRWPLWLLLLPYLILADLQNTILSRPS